MQVISPVSGYPASGPRNRLIEGMVLGRGEPQAVVELFRRIAPAPRFTSFEALNDRVTGCRGVRARVLGG